MTEHPDVAATRTAYDAVAVDYADMLRDELAAKPVDRAMLAAFAEHIAEAGGGEVADLGCGPGRVTEHLAGLGVDAFGIDLSPAMVEVARESYPGLLFEVGTMAALDIPDAALTGAVAWYSIIHTPPERQHLLFSEFARVVRPGGWLLLAFQVGDDVVNLRHAYGHDLELDAYRQDPDRIRALLEAAGFTEYARLVRVPDAPEKVRQAYVLASR